MALAFVQLLYLPLAIGLAVHAIAVHELDTGAVATGILGVDAAWLVSAWRRRRNLDAFDAVGIWRVRGGETLVFAWDSLMGVALYWSQGDEAPDTRTLELCPVPQDGPAGDLMASLLRDGAPLRPGLPRPRYRIEVFGDPDAYEKACLRWAPGLWCGRHRQSRGYERKPR
ncbi:hypothetical protein SRB5_10690 [Streptomyces sp. RB5]|uniref:Uncharacterized protein n=1 Tax=Streptomyces smaragdinus TaxID=2585196 RepID=A0A7K0CBX6_9ACTN|nr:hypothetical protein [Streptomyces smaragdinus]MQY10955.1 hypothetical protein [Streptomyces smaragdinus]